MRLSTRAQKTDYTLSEECKVGSYRVAAPLESQLTPEVYPGQQEGDTQRQVSWLCGSMPLMRSPSQFPGGFLLWLAAHSCGNSRRLVSVMKPTAFPFHPLDGTPLRLT